MLVWHVADALRAVWISLDSEHFNIFINTYYIFIAIYIYIYIYIHTRTQLLQFGFCKIFWKKEMLFFWTFYSSKNPEKIYQCQKY